MTDLAFSSDVMSVKFDAYVGTLWLDNEPKRNAMGPEFWEDLPRAVDALVDAECRVVVLAAKGPHFTVGLDLKAMGGSTARIEGESQATARRRMYNDVKRLQRAISAVAECPVPVIAAIHGWCIGGGIDLICAADIRLASADAKFSVRETKIAITADVGTLQRLPKVLNAGHIAELVYTGKDIDAERARSIGLVNDVCADVDALLLAAYAMAAEIAANSPLAVQGSKAVLQAGDAMTVEQSLDYVALWNAAFLPSNDLTEALTAFMQKRAPTFTGE